MPEFYCTRCSFNRYNIKFYNNSCYAFFWEAVGKESGVKWWYVFIGIGLGLLSKGPIILILTITPILSGF